MNYLPYIIIMIVCGVIGMAVGDMGGKKNGKTGLALGILLGPVGIIIAAVLPKDAESGKKSRAGLLLILAAVVAVLVVAAVVILPQVVR